MKIAIILLLLTSCASLPLPPHGMAGLLVPEEQLPGWAAPPNNFQLDKNEVEIGQDLMVSVGPADYAWGIIYVFTDSKKWEKIVINPVFTKDRVVQQWVKGTANFILPIQPEKFTPGKQYYLVGYLCNKNNGWNCNGNKWMLISFKTTASYEFNILFDEIDEIERDMSITMDERLGEASALLENDNT